MRTVTANGLVTKAMNLLGAAGLADGSPSTAELADGVSRLNDLIDEWATQELTIPQTIREVFTLTAGQSTYSIGAMGDFNTVKPQAIDAASILITPSSGQPYELFMSILTYDGYISIDIKSLPNVFPTALYYNPNQTNSALGQIIVWQVPNQTQSMVLYTGRILAQFDEAAPTTSIILPPGYAKALIYNLAVELYPLYAQQTAPDFIVDGARKALGHIKAQNDNPTVLSTGDAGMMFGSNGQRYSYINFLTGP